LFLLRLGNEDGGVQLVYESACCLAWGVIFYRRKDRGVVCVFSIFNAGGSVCVRVCMYTHTHTHTAQMGYLDVSPGVGWECMCACVCVYAHTHIHCTDGVLGCEPRSRDETPGRPEESRWTKSRYTYIRICVQSTHVYIYAKRRDEILD